MKRSILPIVMVALLCQSEAAKAQPVSAQTDSTGRVNELLQLETQPKQEKLCFRAQGCPNCDAVILLEFTMAKSLGTTSCEEFLFLNGELGLLKNVSNTWGVGGTVFYGGDDCAGRFGFRGRVRHWINRQVGLDLGPGVILARTDDDGFRPSFSGQVALDLFGVIAPVYQLDMERTPNDVVWNSMVGVRTESYGAPVALAGLLILAAATWVD